MDKNYSPKAIEEKWYAIWEQRQYFEPGEAGQPYCIMLPPPNVTGSLHMGHGFQHTLMDILIRYHRMLGERVLWQPGTDHAGISTQLVVERQLDQAGTSRKEMTREAFVERVWEWKETSGNKITSQMRRIGSSTAWSRERFTMDEGLSNAVQKVFIQLYEEGLIYRGKRLVNWDPVLGTAISDLEVISQEEQGFLWHIRYPMVDSNESLVVATTRPETMLGDVAVAVHPRDDRYQAFIGKQLVLPLTDRAIPIIADESIDPAFGTGCVKITPGHDFNDYEVSKRHELPLISIFDKKASLNHNAPQPFQGLDRFEARERILEKLTKQGLLVKTVDHVLKVPRGEKSNAVIEPLLTEQWYVKMAPLAQPALLAVKRGDITFIPENWSKTYFHWMEHIEDWCISRQLWWGHRIPAWYDNKGKIYVGYSENDVRFKYQLDDDLVLQQDEDVLDTWFSSALWPFSTLGWPDKTPELETFYPTSVLLTGFDIIFFWVARMIMMGLKFTGKVPFLAVVITGLICDADGKKMSKSKGNVLDPIDIIDGISLEDLIAKRTEHLLLPSLKEKIKKSTQKEFPEGIAAFGTDALRFAYCALASNTRIVRFDLQRVEGYRHFCNKLWNAARYVLLNMEGENDFEDGAFQYSESDRYILSRLQKTVDSCHHYLKIFRFDLLANCLYEFVWHEYCDWYLELSKPVLYNETSLSAMKRGSRRTLTHVLNHALRLLHPIIPFITEEIWQRTGKWSQGFGETIMLAAYPTVEPSFIDEAIELEIDWVKKVIQAVRTVRSEMTINPGKLIPLIIRNANAKTVKLIDKYEAIFYSLCKLSQITFVDAHEVIPAAAGSVVGELTLLIPLAGLIDVNAEMTRLEKELQKLSKDIALAQTKLENPQFKDKAPAEIIKKEVDKLEQAKRAYDKLLSHQQKLKAV